MRICAPGPDHRLKGPEARTGRKRRKGLRRGEKE